MKKWLMFVLILVLSSGVYALDNVSLNCSDVTNFDLEIDDCICFRNSDCPDDNNSCTEEGSCINHSCIYTTIYFDDGNPLTYDYCEEGEVFHENIVGEFGGNVKSLPDENVPNNVADSPTKSVSTNETIPESVLIDDDEESGISVLMWFLIICLVLFIGVGTWFALKKYGGKKLPVKPIVKGKSPILMKGKVPSMGRIPPKGRVSPPRIQPARRPVMLSRKMNSRRPVGR